MVIPLSDSASADNGVLRKDILGDWLGTGELWGHGALERNQGISFQRNYFPDFLTLCEKEDC